MLARAKLGQDSSWAKIPLLHSTVTQDDLITVSTACAKSLYEGSNGITMREFIEHNILIAHKRMIAKQILYENAQAFNESIVIDTHQFSTENCFPFDSIDIRASLMSNMQVVPVSSLPTSPTGAMFGGILMVPKNTPPGFLHDLGATAKHFQAALFLVYSKLSAKKQKTLQRQKKK